ncbi:unnamed protein product [Rhizophagus irregularis]|nr:unnamed protein product [Rhizophagus irregularis]
MITLFHIYYGYNNLIGVDRGHISYFIPKNLKKNKLPELHNIGNFSRTTLKTFRSVWISRKFSLSSDKWLRVWMLASIHPSIGKWLSK